MRSCSIRSPSWKKPRSDALKPLDEAKRDEPDSTESTGTRKPQNASLGKPASDSKLEKARRKPPSRRQLRNHHAARRRLQTRVTERRAQNPNTHCLLIAIMNS